MARRRVRPMNRETKPQGAATRSTDPSNARVWGLITEGDG